MKKKKKKKEKEKKKKKSKLIGKVYMSLLPETISCFLQCTIYLYHYYHHGVIEFA